MESSVDGDEPAGNNNRAQKGSFASGCRRVCGRLLALSSRALITLLQQAYQKTSAIKKPERTLKYEILAKIKNVEDKWVFMGRMLPHGDFPEREIAIKMLGASEIEERLLNYDDKKKTAERMISEARHALEVIHHPNIVQYIHTCDGGNERIFILMELCHDKTLEDRIMDLENFSELKNAAYCKSVLFHITHAILYLHSRHPPICHRDLKPSNILFSLDGRVVKISDFGYSKKVDPETGTIPCTTSTGTDTYRAPETYNDTSLQRADCLSDVFSLGIVYFFVLSKGKHPFGETTTEQKYNIAQKRNKFLEGLTGYGGALARDLIDGMLKYSQQSRPPASEVLKHPYFWNVQKTVGFYNVVVNNITRPCPTKPLKTSVGDLKKQMLDLNCDLALHPDISSSIERQIHHFFCTAAAIVDIAEETGRGPSKVSGPNEDSGIILEVNKRRDAFFTLLSTPFYHIFDEEAQFYIQVILRIPTALKANKVYQDTDGKSDSSDGGDGDRFWAKNEKYAHSHENSNGYIEEAGDRDSLLGAMPPDQSNSEDTDMPLPNAGDDEDYDRIARKTVERVMSQGPEDEASILLEHASTFPNRLMKEIDKVRDTRVTPTGFDVPSVSVPTQQNTVHTCIAPTEFNLRDEFFPHKRVNALEEEINSAVSEGRYRDVIAHAGLLLKTLRLHDNGRPETKQSGNTTEGSKVGHNWPMIIHQQLLFDNLNNLTLKCANVDECPCNNFEKCVQNIDESNFDISVEAKKLIVNKRSGCKQTWKERFDAGQVFHEDKCGKNCPCVRLVKMSKGKPGEKTFDLIIFIRNKLVHFAADKIEYEENWMKSEEDILNFVASVVPELLPHMFKVMKTELKDFIDENQQLESSFYLPDMKDDQSSRERRVAPVSDGQGGHEKSSDMCLDNERNKGTDFRSTGTAGADGNSTTNITRAALYTPHSASVKRGSNPTESSVPAGLRHDESGSYQSHSGDTAYAVDVDLAYGHQPFSVKFFTDHRDDATFPKTTEASVADTNDPPIQAMTEYPANKVKVAVMFSDYSPTFEGTYRLDETIYDVIADIQKSNEKVTRIKHSQSKKEISRETKIETLLEEGWINCLMAS